MILDKDGNPIPPTDEKPQPHRFGHFIIPENCHIRGLGSIDECRVYIKDFQTRDEKSEKR